MVVLIGAGGHAADIRATSKVDVQYAHHSQWSPSIECPIIIGVNNPQVRAKIAAELGVTDQQWIHPDAYIGPLCYIAPGAHVNYGVKMTRTLVGIHSTIAPGVTICGDVEIGQRVFIGAGATICNLLTIGDDAVIGAGSVVLGDVPAGQRVVGVWKPAK